MAVPSPDALQALDRLSSDPKNVVYIISGRDSGFLDQHLGHLTKLGFSAEHGCFVKEPESDGNATSWTSLTESLDMSWMSEVKEIFEYYTERTTGSFIEMKKSSITWHYRASDPDWGCVSPCFHITQAQIIDVSVKSVSSNADSALTCWKQTLHRSDRLKVNF